jgi:hypothetical protein
MQLFQKLLNKFNGLHYSQEYLCLAKESFQQPLHVYLIHNGTIIKDITTLHLFAGYSPLIFVLSSLLSGMAGEQQTIQLVFSEEQLQPNEAFNKKDAVVLLTLKKIYQQAVNRDTILFFEGVTGRHHFISPFHQFIIQLDNRLYNKRPGNVFLPGNLYKQVQIAYALPRTISLVTVGNEPLFNHFPTDLHGQVNDEFYIMSLRHEGKACQQVETAGRIVISNVNATSFRSVYALGKNHMQPLKDRSVFDFDMPVSKNFRLPLPKNLVSYKELQLQDSFMNGIHKILLFKIIYEEKITDNPSTLAHIHNCYATWRYKQGKTSNFLLR